MSSLSYAEVLNLLGHDLARAWGSARTQDAILENRGVVPPVTVSRQVIIQDGGKTARLQLTAQLLPDDAEGAADVGL